MSDAPNASPSGDNVKSPAYVEKYFEALYRDSNDPWQYQTRWYEQRKRDMCLAILPQDTYANAIELGCGNGVFSHLLTHRCQALLSIDGNHSAVQLARQRLIEAPHTKVLKGVIPDVLLALQNEGPPAPSISQLADAPTHRPPYDLIVISEVLYYLSARMLTTVIAWIQQNIAAGGTLLCCHWRYDIEGFALTGETVHQRLQQAFNQEYKVSFTHQSQLVDSDFLLDIWQNSQKTVAMQEHLV